jgi:K+-sensing histidine kinase KdpD
MLELLYNRDKDTKSDPKEKKGFDEDRDRMHLQMMSAVSHDLKTPLASIIGSLEIHNKMIDSLSEEKKLVLIKTALEEAYRLDGFISNILDMARLENGMTTVSKRSYDVEQIIQDCMYKLTDWSKKADITVIKSSIPIMIETDVSLLSRALQCILDNALKHTGLEQPKVQIEYKVIDEMLVIDIKDSGLGIALEDHQKVFNKYTRLTKKDYKTAGTGLGLTISKAIINLLNGDIYLNDTNSENFPGAWFTIKLPLQ